MQLYRERLWFEETTKTFVNGGLDEQANMKCFLLKRHDKSLCRRRGSAISARVVKISFQLPSLRLLLSFVSRKR